jgi:hypothetical protein
MQQDWIICPYCATRHNPAPLQPARLPLA